MEINTKSKSNKTDFPFPVPDYQYDQKNEMFKRRTWDKEIIPHAARLYSQVHYQEKYGFRKLDFALRNASWNIEYGFAFGNSKGNHGLYSWTHIADKIKRFTEAQGPVQYSPEENTRIIKKATWFLGADLVGISYAHPNLIYSHELDLLENKHHPIVLPSGCKHAVVMAIAMDYDSARYSPDAISGASTGLGYSKQAVLANLVATFIRGLGYQAIPSGNDTALSIPLAMAAGLGELGRMGLLITKKYGPRIRICKVFTDLPLHADNFEPFGVESFCTTCKKCAKNCPSQAIPGGEQTHKGPSASNFSGTKRWYINPKKCFLFWTKNWIDCNNCVNVCPFNKPPGIIHDAARSIIQRMPLLNRLLVLFDDLLGYGKPIPTPEKNFWET